MMTEVFPPRYSLTAITAQLKRKKGIYTPVNNYRYLSSSLPINIYHHHDQSLNHSILSILETNFNNNVVRPPIYPTPPHRPV